MPDANALNPLSAIGLDKFDVGLGAVGNALLLVVLVALIFILVVVGIILWIRKRQFKYRIPLYSRVGNVPTRIATYKAKEVPQGRAGDRLWFVAKAKKFITPPNIQTARNEFWHWLREDGEWINFALGDLDEDSRRTGVKYVHQDMRMQRLAIDRLLEQRLMNKNFWEKWGLVIGYVVFFLMITIAMVIIFWQWGKIIEGTERLIGSVDALLKEAQKSDDTADLVPALLLPFYFKFKFGSKWKKKKKKGFM